jgi:hypothetical protein
MLHHAQFLSSPLPRQLNTPFFTFTRFRVVEIFCYLIKGNPMKNHKLAFAISTALCLSLSYTPVFAEILDNGNEIEPIEAISTEEGIDAVEYVATDSTEGTTEAEAVTEEVTETTEGTTEAEAVTEEVTETTEGTTEAEAVTEEVTETTEGTTEAEAVTEEVTETTEGTTEAEAVTEETTEAEAVTEETTEAETTQETPVTDNRVQIGAGVEITYDETGADSLIQLYIDLMTLDAASAPYVSIAVMEILNADLLVLIPSDAMAGLNAEQLARIPAEALAGLSAAQLAKITPQAIVGLTAEQISYLSLDAVAALTGEHTAALTQEAVSGLSVEQFDMLTEAALAGLNVDNMAGLSAEVIETQGVTLLLKLNPAHLKRLSVGDFLWFVVNMNSAQVQPQQLMAFLPAGWSIHPVTGKLKVPPGKLKLKKIKHHIVLPVGLQLPEFYDLNSTISLGGDGDGENSIVAEIQALLAAKGYPNLRVELDDSGILRVAGDGVELNFVADGEEIEQLEEDAVPDIVVNDEGNFNVITASGLKLTLLTAPRDPVALMNLVPGGEVKLDKKGNVKIRFSGHQYILTGTFDPLVLTAPADVQPGVHVSGVAGENEVAHVVYEDGTMQVIYPSVTDSLGVTWSADFYGTGKIKFHANGRIRYVDDLNTAWTVVPSLNIQLNYSVKPRYPYFFWHVPGEEMVYVDNEGAAQLFYWKLAPSVED